MGEVAAVCAPVVSTHVRPWVHRLNYPNHPSLATPPSLITEVKSLLMGWGGRDVGCNG
jgi:hypothetical protein